MEVFSTAQKSERVGEGASEGGARERFDRICGSVPVRILLELAAVGGDALKSTFLGKGGKIRWASYVLYERDLLEAGLIRVEAEKEFPRRQRLYLTERGRQVVRHLEAIRGLLGSLWE